MKWKDILPHYLKKKSVNPVLPGETASPRDATIRRVHKKKSYGKLTGNLVKPRLDIARTVQRHGATLRECWVFEVISGVDRGRQFVGITHEIKIGRQFDNHIQLNDPKVSRFHAMITQKGSHMVVRDLKSTNGTWINDERVIREKRLVSGDQIKVGETVLNVRYEKEY